MLNKKKLTALLAALMMTFSVAAPVYAEPEETPTEETQTETDSTGNKDGDADSNTDNSEIYLEDPNLEAPDTSHAEAALLMDMDSGRLIYGKNINERLYPASTTKMMTAIIALESGHMNETAAATYEALQSITLDDSHMGILVGEELTITDLLNGMMIASANDAANVIACHLGGSIDGFVELMNAKAQEIGLSNTHFVNPCGVHDDNHYTTANDLAILAQYCMANEQFREMVKKPSYHIAPTNKYKYDRNLNTTNLFLSTARSSYYLYKPCTGIKTGTTDAAGHCLVASAGYEGQNLLSIVLKCDDLDVKENAYSYKITKSLFDFGFNNYQSGTIVTAGTIVERRNVRKVKDTAVILTVESDINALVPRGVNIEEEAEKIINLPDVINAPVHKGDVLGTVTYNYKGVAIGSSNLIAANDVELSLVQNIIQTVIGIITHPLFFIPVLLIIIIALYVRAKKRKAERKKKLKQLRQRREAEEIKADRMSRATEKRRTSAKGANSRYSERTPKY